MRLFICGNQKALEKKNHTVGRNPKKETGFFRFLNYGNLLTRIILACLVIKNPTFI
jgi:hypothetical protein